MIKGLTYAIVLHTDDVPRARRFFTEKLGLGTEDDMGDMFSQFTTREGTLWAIRPAPDEAAPGRQAVPAGRRRRRGLRDLEVPRRRDGQSAARRALRPHLRLQGRRRPGAARLELHPELIDVLGRVQPSGCTRPKDAARRRQNRLSIHGQHQPVAISNC